MYHKQYDERIYAGAVGKIIGVYLGRPVEGWTYDQISRRFGTINYYVNDSTGSPLIVPDDDISGTFVFIRALDDFGYSSDIHSSQIGNTWLNYIIENKTILWWGGLSRSTEHTAFLRLKDGIPAPKSGSEALNGESMATQIGAQIFIDSWAMVNPGNPERAALMAREAASVSHDGIAVEAAVFLAAMESLAFHEDNLERLMQESIRFVRSSGYKKLLDEFTSVINKTDSWKHVRRYIADNHGYDKYPGNCPMITNHLVVLMSLLMGGDSFQKSISIAVSAGWDTDCNAGNVGCLNGIRLGLSGIDAGADLRGPVKDRMYVVSADGGSCISDAVIETKKLIHRAAALDGIAPEVRPERYSFSFPGSVQGFMKHPDLGLAQAASAVENSMKRYGRPGLLVSYAGLGAGTCASVCAETFIDAVPRGEEGTSYFEVLASPSLYPTQTIFCVVEGLHEVNPAMRFFAEYYSTEGSLAKLTSESHGVVQGIQEFSWEVPDTNGLPIFRFGFDFISEKRLDGDIRIESIDWSGAPRAFTLGKSYEMSPDLTPWTTDTIWLKSFMSSADQFYPDYTTTFSLSHPTEGGVVTIGTQDWRDYTVSSKITFMQQKGAGIAARCRGHRRYYAALIYGSSAQIVKVRDGEVLVLAEKDFGLKIDSDYTLTFEVFGDRLKCTVDQYGTVTASDDEYDSGAAGFVVHEGAVLIDCCTVMSLETRDEKR